jgi:hypothetical protein
MGRYPDSSTTLRPTPDGTKWDSGNPDDYSDDNVRKFSVRTKTRLPKAELIELEKAQAKDAGKSLRSFISQCATAYANNKLTAQYPTAPKALKRLVDAVGGNVSWLASEQTYRSLFLKAYCRIRGADIPYEKVWATNRL